MSYSLTFGGATSDRVNLAGPRLDNINSFSIVQWAYVTAQTNGRRFWQKDATGSGRSASLTATTGAFSMLVDRVADSSFTTDGSMFALDTWTCFCFTYDSVDGARGFVGTLTTPMVECTYASRATGSLAEVDDSGGAFVIGNGPSNNISLTGRIAFWAHYKRRFRTLEEIRAHQFCPPPSPDCGAWMRLGKAGKAKVPNEALYGAGDDGVITGTALGDPLPLVFPELARPRRIFHVAAAVGGQAVRSMHQYRQRRIA